VNEQFPRFAAVGATLSRAREIRRCIDISLRSWRAISPPRRIWPTSRQSAPTNSPCRNRDDRAAAGHLQPLRVRGGARPDPLLAPRMDPPVRREHLDLAVRFGGQCEGAAAGQYRARPGANVSVASNSRPALPRSGSSAKAGDAPCGQPISIPESVESSPPLTRDLCNASVSAKQERLGPPGMRKDPLS
jgi:hypothetical protein